MNKRVVFFAESAKVLANPEFARIDFGATGPLPEDGGDPTPETVATCYMSYFHLARLHEAIGRQLQATQDMIVQEVRRQAPPVEPEVRLVPPPGGER